MTTLYRETVCISEAQTEYAKKLNLGVPAGTDGALYESIGRSEDTVWQSDLTMKVGQTASGKTWRRLRRTSLRVFTWRSGRLRYLTATTKRVEDDDGRRRDVTNWQDGTSRLLNNLTEYVYSPRLVPALMEHTGAKDLRSLIRREYPLSIDLPADNGVTPYLALPNIQEFTRAFYGKSRYRKDLVRGVANRGWMTRGGNSYLLMTKAFAPFIPVDWIARDLNDLPLPTFSDLGSGSVMFSLRSMRRMLRSGTEKQVRLLWKDREGFSTNGAWMMMDIFRSLQEIHRYAPDYKVGDITFNSWRSLHDILAEDQRRIRTRNQDIKHSGEWLKLVGKYDSYDIIAPADTHTLVKWGGEMANCIGGYTSEAVQNRTMLYAVLKDGKMICNMEIEKSGKLRQMVGKHNSTLPREDHDAIYAIVDSVWKQNEGAYYVGARRVADDERDDGLADWERELLNPFEA